MSQRLIESGPHKGKPALTKAEVLFTRRCPLRCSGCSIFRVDENGVTDNNQADAEEATMDEWFRTLDNLSELGTQFIALYGAEPAQVPNRVASFLHYAENIVKIPTSVITSGVGLTTDILDLWWNSGLRSLTMSVDGLADDQTSSVSSKVKTNKAWQFLKYWVEKYGSQMRDAEGCMTLTRKNVAVLPELIKVMTDKNVWLHFDMIHSNRGQPYSKVERHVDLTGLMFESDEDVQILNEAIDQVIAMKSGGYLIHPSVESLIGMKKHGPKMDWQCCQGESGFLGFVTVDPNCVIRPCDDFLPPEMDTPKDHARVSPERLGKQVVRDGNKKVLRLLPQSYDLDVPSTPVFGWELSARFEEYKKRTKEMVEKHNCRCYWATHADAQSIYEGRVSIEHYIHRQISDT